MGNQIFIEAVILIARYHLVYVFVETRRSLIYFHLDGTSGE